MEHVDVLRKLQEKWREELGDTEYNSERDVRLLCADELDHVIHALSAQGEAVAYALKNSKTGEMFWDEDECIWSDSSGAEYYAEILNDRGDGEEFAVAPLYTHPQPQGAVVDDAQGEAAAWMASDGRVISARQKERAIRDGGASASSVSVYSDPLYARTQPQGAVLDDAPTAWISDNDLLKLRESVDDARNIRMTTERTHLRIHPVYIPALVAALREGE